MTLGEALVHPVEVRGEERGFVSTGARADFHDRIAFVMGVARDEERMELLGDLGNFGRSRTRSALASGTSS